MDYTFGEIDQLAEILDAEYRGLAVDRSRGRKLALRLIQLCPEIQGTMSRVATRMTAEAGENR